MNLHHFGWSPELVPETSEHLEIMGNRQATFEQALEKNLGHAPTEVDLKAARAMFEGDSKIREAWETMFQHEVQRYAAKVAARIQRELLIRSSPQGE